MFTKETFILVIDALEKQYEYDKGYVSVLSGVLNADGVQSYDNSSLTNLLFTLLQRQFVPIGGVCEIERYCYELNFGYAEGNRIITPDHLWDALLERRALVVDSVAFGHPFSEASIVPAKGMKGIIEFEQLPIGERIYLVFEEDHKLNITNSLKVQDAFVEIDAVVEKVIDSKTVLLVHNDSLKLLHKNILAFHDITVPEETPSSNEKSKEEKEEER